MFYIWYGSIWTQGGWTMRQDSANSKQDNIQEHKHESRSIKMADIMNIWLEERHVCVCGQPPLAGGVKCPPPQPSPVEGSTPGGGGAGAQVRRSAPPAPASMATLSSLLIGPQAPWQPALGHCEGQHLPLLFPGCTQIHLQRVNKGNALVSNRISD